MNLFNIFKRSNPIEKRDINLDPIETDQTPVSFGLDFFKNYAGFQSMSLSSVYAAIELISNSVASLPIHIKDKKSGEIIDHPIQEIFNNSMVSKFILVKQLIVDMLLSGNGIAYIQRQNGKPNSLIYLSKSQYTINYIPETRKLTYSIPSISSKPIQPKDVIHILKNSNNGVIGLGLQHYALRALKIGLAADSHAQDYFDSGASITGILKSSKHLSKKQQSEIRQTWNMTHNGQSGSGLAVVGVDLDYIPMSQNASDSQLLETRLFTVSEVARFFNISPVLLGDLSHSSYATIEASQLEFLTHTLTPYIEILENEFNRKLISKEDNVVFDWDEMHLLLADKQSTASYLSIMVSSGIMSINEARHTINMEPIPDGDKHFVAYTDINQNTINKKQSENQDSDDK